MSNFIKGKIKEKNINQEFVDEISNYLESVIDDEKKLYTWLDKLVQDKKNLEGELKNEN